MPKIDLEAIEKAFPFEDGNRSDARRVIKQLVTRVRELEAENARLRETIDAFIDDPAALRGETKGSDGHDVREA